MSGSQAVVTAARRGLQTAGLLRPGVTVVAALSGGADSVVLLHAIQRVARRAAVSVVAAHFDHALRPDSAGDARFCAALCARLKIRLRTGIARGPSPRGGGPEEAARLARYSFLRRVAREEGASAIAVAHTLNDQAETVLMRLIRGAGAEGLSGMTVWDGELLRPLLDVSKSEINSYLDRVGLAHVEDATNVDRRFLRNRVRHDLLPLLRREFNPQIEETLARTARLLRDDARTIAEMAQALLDRSRLSPSAMALDSARLRSAPAGLRRAVIRDAVRRTGGLRSVSAIHLERLDLLLTANRGGSRLPLPGGRSAEVRSGKLFIRGPEHPSAGRLGDGDPVADE
jgi:tRNA(Ile)-lysidine synthase